LHHHDQNELLNRSIFSNGFNSGTPGTKTKNQTGSGLFHSIVKEQVLPGQLEGRADNRQFYAEALKSQAWIPKKSVEILRAELRENFAVITCIERGVCATRPPDLFL
jgi:hypothetical protein